MLPELSIQIIASKWANQRAALWRTEAFNEYTDKYLKNYVFSFVFLHLVFITLHFTDWEIDILEGSSYQTWVSGKSQFDYKTDVFYIHNCGSQTSMLYDTEVSFRICKTVGAQRDGALRRTQGKL